MDSCRRQTGSGYMRRFSFRLTLVTLLAGGAGAILRHFELGSAFEASGLAKPWAPMTVLLALFSLAYVVFLFLASRRLGSAVPPEGYAAAFAFRSGLKLALHILVSLLLFAAAILCLMGARSYGPFGEPIFQAEIGALGLLAAISGLCTLLLSLSAYRQEDRGGLPFFSLAPVLFYCLLLIVLYKNRAADPVIRDYVYELFSVCATLLALFFAAGSACGRPRPKRTVFFGQLGLFFSLVTLADGHELWMTAICVFSCLWLLLNTYSYGKNLQKSRPAAPAEPELQAEPAPPAEATLPEDPEIGRDEDE